MAVLENIRVKMGAFITILIGIALVGFIINWDDLARVISSDNNMGKIDGTTISYQDYNSKLETLKGIFGRADEQSQDAMNSTAWQEFINEIVLIPEIQAAGVRVGDEEMVAMVNGQSISPILASQPYFVNENGEFDPARVAQFVQAIPQDATGGLRTYWNYIEDQTKTERFFTKYVSLLEKSNVANALDVKRALADNNTTFDVDFVVKPFGFQQDSTIKVSDAEISAYYNKHKESFKNGENSSDVEYVRFEVVPSGDDIDKTEKEIEALETEFQTTTNLKAFVTRNSDQPYNDFYYTENELTSLSDELGEFAKGAATGAYLPHFRKDNSFIAARIADVREMPDSVFVQHILLQGNNAAKADSLVNEINNGKSIAELATAFSADKNSNVEEAGDLGWMTQRYILPGFESIFKAKKGDILKLNSSYGLHIVKIKDAKNFAKRYNVAMLVKESVPSDGTRNEYRQQAMDLASASAGSIEKFRQAANEKGYSVIPAKGIGSMAKQINNITDAREVVRWVNENKPGVVNTEEFDIGNGSSFLVLGVTAKHEKGYANEKELASQIRQILAFEKQGQKVAEEAKKAVEGATSIEQVAEKLGSTVSNKSGISFASVAQQLDPKFVGAISAAKENTLSGPVVGNFGVYYFVVKNKEVGEFYTEADVKQKKSQEFAFVSRIIPAVMSSKVDITDNRGKFF